jgi:hypothetical protein
MKLKHKVSLFLVYFTLFSALAAMIDYYAYDILNPWIFVSISFILAVIVTMTHIKHHTRSKADELAKDLEEIL